MDDVPFTDTTNIINFIEIKGSRSQIGGMRRTDKEYSIAKTYKDYVSSSSSCQSKSCSLQVLYFNYFRITAINPNYIELK